MDVDAVSFPSRLLGILTEISRSDFVAIDFELSGVASKDHNAPRGRHTLEQRYQEIKASAEKFQILQVGITCAKFDFLADKYVLRPYNINISPLIDEHLGVERIFAFQSGAIQFLLRNGFHIDLPFTKGVQYLSRAEAKKAKELAHNRINKVQVAEDLQLPATAVDSLEFVQRVREAITEWKAKNLEDLEVSSSTGKANQPGIQEVSRFEKRLVHQLVRAEFPDLITISRPNHIRIIRYDARREADSNKTRKRMAKQQISRQTGFRWVVEALVKGDLDDIDPEYFARDTNGLVVCANLYQLKSEHKSVSVAVKQRQPVLVGHNMFTDLIYFYSCFLGPLPDTLEGFRDAIHELFPRIVDTKYVVTHDCGDINPTSSLQETANHLYAQPLPNIVIHSDHQKYHDTVAHHEAGYDSLLTATVLIRLSAKLDTEKEVNAVNPPDRPLPSDSETYETAPETPGEGQGSPAMTPEKAPQLIAQNITAKKRKKKRAFNRKADSRFATETMFETLRSLELDSHGDENEAESGGDVVNEGNENPTNGDISWTSDTQHTHTTFMTVERKPMELMPSFESPFWMVHGNQLRVFGTVESSLVLGAWDEKAGVGLNNIQW